MPEAQTKHLECRACKHTLGVPATTKCSECGLDHALHTSTPRDRLPSLAAAVLMLTVALFSCIVLARMAHIQRNMREVLGATNHAAEERNDQLTRLQDAIDRGDLLISGGEQSRTWKIQNQVYTRRPTSTIPPLPSWSDSQLPSMTGGSIMSGIATLCAAVLAFTTYVRRFGNLTPRDEQLRTHAVAGWTCFLLTAWLIVALS